MDNRSVDESSLGSESRSLPVYLSADAEVTAALRSRLLDALPSLDVVPVQSLAELQAPAQAVFVQLPLGDEDLKRVAGLPLVVVGRTLTRRELLAAGRLGAVDAISLEELTSDELRELLRTLDREKTAAKRRLSVAVPLSPVKHDSWLEASELATHVPLDWDRLLLSLPDQMYVISDDGIVAWLHLPDSSTSLLFSLDNVGRPLSEVLPAAAADKQMACVAELKIGDAPTVWEFEATVGGEVRIFEARSRSYADRQVLTILRDITMRRKAEVARQTLLAGIEQAAESIVITDVDGVITYVNPTFERVSGYSRDEAIGRKPNVLKSGMQDDGFYRDMWARIRSGETWCGRIINRRKDGSLYVEDAVISPIRDAAGQTVAYVSTKRDVTEEVRLEERLRQSEKMRAIGQLAGGIAHDFNNQLTVILGFTQMMERRLVNDDSLRRYCEIISKACHSSADLTQQLLAFARKGKNISSPTDMNVVVQDVVSLLRRSLDKRIAIQTTFQVDMAMVTGDPSQLQSMVLNIAMNASEAMPNGGTIRIDTRRVVVSLEDTVAQDPDVAVGRYIQVEITDDGIGMDAETVERVFEPFFTTKSDRLGAGKGTGMGLAAVYGTVRNHGGFVHVASKIDHGSTFTIYLPESESLHEVNTDSVDGRKVAKVSGRRILVVDDEDQVRFITSEMLEELGHKVVTVASGDEAVRFYREHGSEVDVVVLDMIMPGLNGRETFIELLAIDPHVKVLLTSGFSLSGEVQAALDAGAQSFLQKPFKIMELNRAIAKIVNAHSL